MNGLEDREQRSPHLDLLNFFWDHFKNEVLKGKPHIIEEIKNRTRLKCSNISYSGISEAQQQLMDGLGYNRAQKTFAFEHHNK